MSENTSLKQTALLSLIPISFLLLIQGYLAILQLDTKISPFILAFLVCQLLCNLVFAKGEICFGQRSRLINSYYFFAVFWLVQLPFYYQQLSLLAISLAGLMMILLVSYHKKLPIFISISSVLGALAFFGYLFELFSQTPLVWVTYSPLVELLIGVVLLNFALLISKNRLQGFIALLPFVMAILLVANIFILLFNLNNIPLNNLYAVLLYFISHLALMAVLIWHIFTKNKLGYMSLSLLLFISAFLPIWLSIAQLA